MERRRFGPDDAGAPGREEVGLGLERGRAGSRRKVENRRRRAHRIGERHQRPAVQRAPHRAQLVPDRQLGDHALGRRLDEPHPQQLAQRPLQALIDGGALVHDLPPLRIILPGRSDDNYLRGNCDSRAPIATWPPGGAIMLLRSTLVINGVSTVLCGLVLLAAPGTLAELLGVSAPALLAVVGGGLVLYAAGLLWTARRQPIPRRGRRSSWTSAGSSAASPS